MAGRSGAAATVGSTPPVMAAAAASGTQSAGRSSAQTSTIPRSESFPAPTATSSTRWSGTRLGPRMTREYFPGGSSRRNRPPVSLRACFSRPMTETVAPGTPVRHPL